MKSRVARLVLLFLFIVALGATAYLYWRGESLAQHEYAALRSFDDKAIDASRSIVELRAAQQAYVAAGQAGDFWPGKVSAAISSLKAVLAVMRTTASSTAAASEIDSALSTLADFTQLDRRARAFTSSGQSLLASDLIFGDGLALAGAVDARIQAARTAEVGAREASMATFRSRQTFALVAAAAAATLVLLLLFPQSEPDTIQLAASAAASAQSARAETAAGSPLAASSIDLDLEAWSPPKRLTVVPRTEPEEERDASRAAPVETVSRTTPPPAEAHTDFSGVALLCTDLARVIDTQQLPSMLDRASALLDAKGIILWIADPDGRELNATVAHGYAPQLVDRLGTIPRDAENATAAAFRTELLQTVPSDTTSNGAIAAPLVTPGGCVGVMAAELRNEGEREETRLAAAAIVAAQLATLVGPPTKAQGKAEAAGA
jgi:hypothetical protein